MTAKAQRPTQAGSPDLITQANNYFHGVNGVAKDISKAFTLYLQAAQSGNAEAMNKVGLFYKEGIVVPANKEQAMYWLTRSAENGFAKAYFNLGTIYKDNKGAGQDFTKAFYYYSKGAVANDLQSIYSKGYLLYKGFGCTQEYMQAVECFKQGASKQKANCMYYLGLCYRNGYGITKNTDSAKYWLEKAWFGGERMALQELRSSEPENNNGNLTAYAATLKSKTMVTKKASVNQVSLINNTIEAYKIEGSYKGFIIKYDWSNQHAISKTSLEVELKYDDNLLTGTWVEGDNTTTPFEAILTTNNLIFKNTSYQKTGHYNPTIPLIYNFSNAKLQWQTIDNSMVLSGTIQMINQYANEPHKPQYIYLTKYKDGNNTKEIKLLNDDGTEIKSVSNVSVYPNPFSSIVNVEFNNKETQRVIISLVAADEKVMYYNDLGSLQIGKYAIAIQPNQLMAAGIYIVKMQFGTKVKNVKIVKNNP
jgi:hypothetical protein